MSRSVVVFALQRHSLRHTDPNKTIVIVVLGVRTITIQSSRAKTWNILGKLGRLGCKADPCAVTGLHNEQPYNFAGTRKAALGRGETHRARRDRLYFLITVIISLVGGNGECHLVSAVLPEPAPSEGTVPLTPPACIHTRCSRFEGARSHSHHAQGSSLSASVPRRHATNFDDHSHALLNSQIV